MEGVIGYVTLFAGNFAPRNWAFCSGQIISIASNTALFSILGTTYGGNGTTTFQLPNLQGRHALGAGQGPGLSNWSLGQVGGTVSHQITANEMPAHAHAITGTVKPIAAATSSTGSPVAASYGLASENAFNPGGAATMASYNLTFNLGLTGNGNAPISLEQPYLGLNYIVCLRGVFPARN